MKIAYFDCFAGAGGDMIAAAMLDAGLDAEFLKGRLESLGIDGLDIKISQTKRGGLRAQSFVPAFPEEQHSRNLDLITDIINKSKIPQAAKETAIAIFNKLADAEAAVHGKDPQDIHFHEIGAVDSIVDIVSAAVGLEFFKEQGLKKVYCSALSVGGGTVQCSHGLMPVPAPATAELLKGVPVKGGPINAELLTPTAAAILITIVDEFRTLPAMKIEAIGYGAGSLESDKFPNVLRLVIGKTADDLAETDSVCLLETNVDDISGEVTGFVTEGLFKQGALDVYTTPIFMKHNRPGITLSVLCKINDAEKLEQIIFEQGLTLGIRKQILQRSKLAREFVTVDTKFGKIKIKVGILGGKPVTAKPEFADCTAAAKEHGTSVRTVSNAAMAAYNNQR